MTELPLYRPSNGSEGDGFMEGWCDRCERDRAFREATGDAEGCEILCRTLIYDITDPEYPREWVEGEDGPKCTAFIEDGGQYPTDRDLESEGQASLFEVQP